MAQEQKNNFKCSDMELEMSKVVSTSYCKITRMLSKCINASSIARWNRLHNLKNCFIDIVNKNEVLKDRSKWDKQTREIFNQYLYEFESSFAQLEALIAIQANYKTTQDLYALQKSAPGILLCNHVFAGKLQCKLMRIIDPQLDIQLNEITVKIIILNTNNKYTVHTNNF